MDLLFQDEIEYDSIEDVSPEYEDTHHSANLPKSTKKVCLASIIIHVRSDNKDIRRSQLCIILFSSHTLTRIVR